MTKEMTQEQLARFDAASDHPYECRCELCKEWWELVGPEREGDIDDDMGVDEWEDDDEFDEAMDNCHGHFDEPGPGGIFQCGAVGSEDCDECPMHSWLGLTNRQIDRLEESIDE